LALFIDLVRQAQRLVGMSALIGDRSDARGSASPQSNRRPRLTK
jgi:hypothetical protein